MRLHASATLISYFHRSGQPAAAGGKLPAVCLFASQFAASCGTLMSQSMAKRQNGE